MTQLIEKLIPIYGGSMNGLFKKVYGEHRPPYFWVRSSLPSTVYIGSYSGEATVPIMLEERYDLNLTINNEYEYFLADVNNNVKERRRFNQ